jgi:hypothetical protein
MDNPNQPFFDDNQFENFMALADFILGDDPDSLSNALEGIEDENLRRFVLNFAPEGMLPLLHLAALRGDLEACQVLVGQGARIEARDAINNRAIDLVAAQDPQARNDALYQWLLQQHAEAGQQPPAVVAPAEGNRHQAKRLERDDDDGPDRKKAR